jgi:hypothetical protein
MAGVGLPARCFRCTQRTGEQKVAADKLIPIFLEPALEISSGQHISTSAARFGTDEIPLWRAISWRRFYLGVWW